jgi:hypothetical protein
MQFSLELKGASSYTTCDKDISLKNSARWRSVLTHCPAIILKKIPPLKQGKAMSWTRRECSNKLHVVWDLAFGNCCWHTHILLTAESEQTERLAVWAGSNYSDQTALFLTMTGGSTEWDILCWLGVLQTWLFAYYKPNCRMKVAMGNKQISTRWYVSSILQPISFSRIIYFSFLVCSHLFASLLEFSQSNLLPSRSHLKEDFSTEASIYCSIYEMGADCFPLQTIKLCYILLTTVAWNWMKHT